MVVTVESATEPPEAEPQTKPAGAIGDGEGLGEEAGVGLEVGDAVGDGDGLALGDGLGEGLGGGLVPVADPHALNSPSKSIAANSLLMSACSRASSAGERAYRHHDVRAFAPSGRHRSSLVAA